MGATDIITNELLQFVKVIGLIFALVHFLIGAVLVRQMTRMNQIIQTSVSGFFNLIAFLYLIALTIVLVLIILI
jgi:hypothetical protein